MRVREMIPWGMAAWRAALGPALVAGQMCGWNGFVLAGIVLAALLSDIFDGVLARRWGCDTAAVRLFDSMADTCFYLCVAAALWVGMPEALLRYGAMLGVLLTLEAVRFGFDLAKFRRPASYHSYMAKSWGFVMAVAMMLTFALQRSNWMIGLALGLGIACDLEGLAMSMILPKWRRDVKTLAAAWRQRWEMRAASGPVERMSLATLGKAVAIAVLIAGGQQLVAEPLHATYMSGTSTLAAGTQGGLDVASLDKMVFRPVANGTDAASTEIAIPYAQIKSFRYYTERMYPTGIVGTIVVGLIKRPARRHLFTITYGDEASGMRTVLLEMPVSEPPALWEVLKARAPQSCKGACPFERDYSW